MLINNNSKKYDWNQSGEESLIHPAIFRGIFV